MIRLFGVYVPIKSVILVITESVLILASIFLAVWIRLGNLTDASWYLSRPYASAQIAVATLICVICLYYNDLYDLHAIDGLTELVVHLMQSLGIVTLVLALLYYIAPDLAPGRGIAVLAAVLTFITLLMWRVAVDEGKFFRPVRRVVIAGTGASGIRLVREILSHPELNLQVVGFLDEKGENIGKQLVNPRIVGPVAEIANVVTRERVDWVILAFAERRGVVPAPDLLRLKFSGVTVEDAHSVFEQLTGSVMLEMLSASWLFLSDGFRKGSLLMFSKRALDIGTCTLALILLSPLFLLIAVCIFLESGRPILFRQERVGLHAQTFEMLKFRSMKRDAEARKAVWASPNDPRVTRIGRVLRRCRLDELPQLINILRGDMSLVGPRPERPEFVQLLAEQIPFYSQRHSIRPGLTGWAQIRYQYGGSVGDAKAKLEYELFYIKHLSLFLDLAIVFRTVQVVFSGRGSR
jgi:sugar transferase (PEP-CTERM system associated)